MFCDETLVGDVMSGLKGFVVKFMIRMSQVHYFVTAQLYIDKVFNKVSHVSKYPESPVSGDYVAHAQTVDTRPSL